METDLMGMRGLVVDGCGGGRERCWSSAVSMTLLHLHPPGVSARQTSEVNGTNWVATRWLAAAAELQEAVVAAPPLQVRVEAGTPRAEGPLQTQRVPMPRRCSHTRSHVV